MKSKIVNNKIKMSKDENNINPKPYIMKWKYYKLKYIYYTVFSENTF